MTKITVDRDLMERALKIIESAHVFSISDCEVEIRAALAATPSGPEKCGHCGRRTIDPPWTISRATQQPAPAWHDAPDKPGIWLCDEGDICYTWTANSIEILDIKPEDDARWFGPIPEDTK
jgi:hypothetical protein